MQLTHWLSLCAFVCGIGVVFIESFLGEERVMAFIGPYSDLRIIGGAVALIGALTLLIGDLEGRGLLRSKSPSHE